MKDKIAKNRVKVVIKRGRLEWKYNGKEGQEKYCRNRRRNINKMGKRVYWTYLKRNSAQKRTLKKIMEDNKKEYGKKWK